MISLKSAEEIGLIRESCRIVADVLKVVGARVQPGVTTLELDKLAEEYIRSMDAVPAFKGYGWDKNNLFPATLCTSVDAEVVHGIPSNRVLREGEIISLDVGAKKNGYYGDGAWTFAVGSVSEEKQRLMQVTQESLMLGIAQASAGNRVHDISSAVQQYVELNGFSIVRDLVGHGVGKKLHEDPSIPNFGEAGTGAALKNGMTLAIEPMVNAGTWRVKIAQDGWTVFAADGKPSAHFEHTIAIVNGNAEILTQS
ncbi:MAG TPA: type I methionyl aminopeptidase [Bacteroidota bacterium]|nr:type I methionyl aminopeptidase [Bacteroidota bacterium]